MSLTLICELVIVMLSLLSIREGIRCSSPLAAHSALCAEFDRISSSYEEVILFCLLLTD